MRVLPDNDFVRLFQGRFGLSSDGVAGARTIGKLGETAPITLPHLTLPLDDDAFVRLFQQLHGLVVDGWAGRDTIARLDRIAPPQNLPAVGIPASYWPMLSKIESADRPYIKALTSSASGLYQFIKSTWLGEGGKWGADMAEAFGGLKPTPEEQTDRAKSFTRKNALYLQGKKIPINRATLYAAHFLGPLTAAAVIGADVDADAAMIAGPAATRANLSIFTRELPNGKRRNATVSEFLTWLQKKTGEWAR
ncbi:peptidoglycan-binding domain-containing protein [Sphingobium sp.]|uniref:peptidoglycan-binding domain-containing protein n=1 Tax=Sphingobium sp. TaxID=1912891 RepID=UPI0025806A42|nr:peptidoglycan-binding domain-containing protein [Sphingobium sp.]MBR2270415.1 peptidoglycan-binding protein [Sphingobium sp.]